MRSYISSAWVILRYYQEMSLKDEIVDPLPKRTPCRRNYVSLPTARSLMWLPIQVKQSWPMSRQPPKVSVGVHLYYIDKSTLALNRQLTLFLKFVTDGQLTRPLDFKLEFNSLYLRVHSAEHYRLYSNFEHKNR